MKRISLRLRIFIWYAAAILVIIIGLAFLAQQFLVEGLRNSLDYRLHERTDAVARVILSLPRLSTDAYEPLIEALTEDQLPFVPAILRVADPQGRVLAAFGEIPDPIVSVMDTILRNPREIEGVYDTVAIRNQEALRVFTTPLIEPARNEIVLIIQTGDSLGPVTTARTQLWRYTIAVGLGGSVLAIGVGFVILQQGFKPLDRILRSIRLIGEKNLTPEIPAEPGPPELRDLAETLATMFSRIESAIKARELFVAGVSHDLRTPLTVLRGEVDMMLAQPGLDVEKRESLEKMSLEVKRLTRMTNNLLLSSQLESHTEILLEEVDLGDLLNESVEEMKTVGRDHVIKLKLTVVAIVDGDRDTLKQMLLNLLENAIKFTPSGGSIAASLGSESGYAIIELEDTGRGIEPEDLPHVTEPFKKMGKSFAPGSTGFGLGLAIVKQIIDLHHGELKIRSEPGSGTTVTVRLPLIPLFHD